MVEVKQLIRDLRYGFKDIESLTDDGLECLLDYYLPEDVKVLCLSEIHRRREERLAEAKG